MRTPFRLQASAFLLAMVMPLAQGVAAEESNEASVASLKQDVQNLSQELSDFTAERRDQLMTDIEKVLASLDDRIARRLVSQLAAIASPFQLHVCLSPLYCFHVPVRAMMTQQSDEPPPDWPRSGVC